MAFDAIVLGGGAAGLFCAAEAGRRGRRVLVLEKNSQPGRKILISGGGRCNFTNLSVTHENFVSENPHFARSALARYTSTEFIELVRSYKIAYYEKKLGQLFCRDSSHPIVDMLLKECERSRVKIRTGCEVRSVKKTSAFEVETSQGVFTAEKLIIATGGLSFAKIGATGLGYQIAEQFGIDIVKTRPSLVPLVIKGKSFPDLSGISAEAEVTAGKRTFRENILFTHRGLSGPAILQISNYWSAGTPVSIDLLPDTDVEQMIADDRASRSRLDNFLSAKLPLRVIQAFIKPKPLYQMNDKEIESAASAINLWRLEFRDTEGYDRAEVTLGGISTAEISSKTMEAVKVPGLFFIGEVVDVTGWLGGYNFQWAWSSGSAAAAEL
jgi:predicted Rossmann fold flavoprotein